MNHLNKTVELLFELLRKKKKKEYSENPNLSLDLNSDRENKNEGRKDLAVHFFVLIGKLHDDLTLHSHLWEEQVPIELRLMATVVFKIK